jgi:hypothetical protein
MTNMFDSIQLIPASSGHDLPNIRRETGVKYRDMLFFDDESPNVRKASPLSQQHASGHCLVSQCCDLVRNKECSAGALDRNYKD